MKKTKWIPIFGGLIFGALSYLTTAANLTIQVSKDLILAPWEIFNAISSALFGPVGAVITELGLDISGYVYIIRGVYPAPQDLNFMIGNYIAHIVAMMILAYSYRLIYQRMKIPFLLLGWILTLGLYYLVGVALSVFLHNIAVPGLSASYTVYLSSVRLEFILVTLITSLILLALPERYRKPQWYEPKQTPDQILK